MLLRMKQTIWLLGIVMMAACVGPAFGQATVPDAPQPQSIPQAKPAVIPPPDSTASPQVQPPPRSDDAGKNIPFPAEEAGQPETQSPDKAATDKPAPAKSPAQKDDFPFPDEPAVPPTAAPVTPAKTDLPPPPPPTPGFSSSATLHDEGSGAAEHLPSPKRAAEDKSVAHFYWNRGDYEGSYLRFKDAVVYAPQDAEMWFGLAESERMLGRYVSARTHYEQYLQLSPHGAKAGAAAKYLHNLPEKDKSQPQGPGPRIP